MSFIAGVYWFYDDPTLKQSAKALVRSLADSTTSEFHSDFCVVIASDGGASYSLRPDGNSAGGFLALSGRLFPTGSAPTDFINERDRIVLSRGDWLAKHAWGEYILAIADEHSGKLHLFRDPTGLGTLYYASTPTFFVFSSDLSSVCSLLSTQLELDEGFLANYIVFGAHNSQRTAFHGVSELRPGHRLEVRPRHVKESCYWNPIPLARPSKDKPVIESKELLQSFLDTVRSCLGNTGGIYIDLSGGLDSSALLAAAVKAYDDPGAVVAGTVFHPSVASATELEYSREVANALGVELVELNGEDLLPATPVTTPLRMWDKPSAHLLHLRLHEAHDAAAEQRGCATSASGYGGDQVFHARMDKPYHFSDYLGYGTLSRLWGELKTSLTWGTSIPRAIGQTAALMFDHRLMGNHGYLFQSKPRWATPELLGLADSRSLLPTYWKHLRGVAPLKARQILEIYDASANVDRGFRSFGKRMHHPFLAQPLAEIGLLLSTDQLIAEGLDRVAFRNAVAELVPRSVVTRSTKGEYSGMYQLGLRRNLKFVEAMILEGWLSRNRLILKDELKIELRLAAQGYSANIWPLLHVIAVELWIQAWKGSALTGIL